MKNRKLALLLCLMLLFSVLSPATALAAPPELETPVDDPLEPAPYTYINSIGISFTIGGGGATTDCCETYIPNTAYSCTLTMRLQEKVDGVWNTTNPIKKWSTSGRDTVYLDETYNSVGYGTYRLSVTVDVYSGSTIVESVTRYSRVAVYSSKGVTYYI